MANPNSGLAGFHWNGVSSPNWNGMLQTFKRVIAMHLPLPRGRGAG
jgi:hypothetical protein